jgi:hypothetical protein
VSYSTVLAALHTRLATVAGIAVLLDYEPMSLQELPALYSLLDSVERSYGGTVVTIHYRVLHRLCFRWQDEEQAEQELIPFVNSVPAALDEHNMRGGDVTVPNVEAVFVTIGGVLYRALDFYSETEEILRLGNG